MLKAIVTIYSCAMQVDSICVDIEENPCERCKGGMGVFFYYLWISGNDRMRCVNCGSMIPALPQLKHTASTRDAGAQGLVGRIDELIRLISHSCPRCSDAFHGIGTSGWLSREDQLYRHDPPFDKAPEICPASEHHQRLVQLLEELMKLRPPRKLKLPPRTMWKDPRSRLGR